MMPFGVLFSFYLFLGSGPNRGQSPVEWGEIPYVRLFPLGLLGGPQAGPQTPLVGLQTQKVDGRMDGCTGFFPILQDFVPCWGR